MTNEQRLQYIIFGVILIVLVASFVYVMGGRSVVTKRETSSPIATTTPAIGSAHTPWEKDKLYFRYIDDDKKLFFEFTGMKEETVLGVKKNYPHFINPESKAEFIILDAFIVEVKEGTTRKALEALNSKHNVSIIEEPEKTEGSKNIFRLKIENSSGTDVLDMANFYHTQDIIEWAEPEMGFRPTFPDGTPQ